MCTYCSSFRNRERKAYILVFPVSGGRLQGRGGDGLKEKERLLTTSGGEGGEGVDELRSRGGGAGGGEGGDGVDEQNGAKSEEKEKEKKGRLEGVWLVLFCC
ncbi:hypothetical protein Syun_029156 [Stephania yunnanensis]|uniref:Uncharacterized protein n=1 Tax=Stephania yunnanensis TaxID=152371 RepID=A0AAP0E9F0_9MAGN